MGLIDPSHFASLDVEGPDHEAPMDWVCAAKIGKSIDTHVLDHEAMALSTITDQRANRAPRGLGHHGPPASHASFLPCALFSQPRAPKQIDLPSDEAL